MAVHWSAAAVVLVKAAPAHSKDVDFVTSAALPFVNYSSHTYLEKLQILPLHKTVLTSSATMQCLQPNVYGNA